MKKIKNKIREFFAGRFYKKYSGTALAPSCFKVVELKSFSVIICFDPIDKSLTIKLIPIQKQ